MANGKQVYERSQFTSDTHSHNTILYKSIQTKQQSKPTSLIFDSIRPYFII